MHTRLWPHKGAVSNAWGMRSKDEGIQSDSGFGREGVNTGLCRQEGSMLGDNVEATVADCLEMQLLPRIKSARLQVECRAPSGLIGRKQAKGRSV